MRQRSQPVNLFLRPERVLHFPDDMMLLFGCQDAEAAGLDEALKPAFELPLERHSAVTGEDTSRRSWCGAWKQRLEQVGPG